MSSIVAGIAAHPCGATTRVEEGVTLAVVDFPASVTSAAWGDSLGPRRRVQSWTFFKVHGYRSAAWSK